MKVYSLDKSLNCYAKHERYLTERRKDIQRKYESHFFRQTQDVLVRRPDH